MPHLDRLIDEITEQLKRAYVQKKPTRIIAVGDNDLSEIINLKDDLTQLIENIQIFSVSVLRGTPFFTAIIKACDSTDELPSIKMGTVPDDEYSIKPISFYKRSYKPGFCLAIKLELIAPYLAKWLLGFNPKELRLEYLKNFMSPTEFNQDCFEYGRHYKGLVSNQLIDGIKVEKIISDWVNSKESMVIDIDDCVFNGDGDRLSESDFEVFLVKFQETKESVTKTFNSDPEAFVYGSLMRELLLKTPGFALTSFFDAAKNLTPREIFELSRTLGLDKEPVTETLDWFQEFKDGCLGDDRYRHRHHRRL